MELHPIFAGAKAVIFDKDGTLLDHDATWVEPTKEFGLRAAGGRVEIAEQLLRAQNFDWDSEEFLGGDGVAGNTWDETARRFHNHLTELGQPVDRLDDALTWIKSFQAPATALPGIKPLLRALREAGFAIGLATNDVGANARVHMDQLGLRDYFDTLVGSDSGYGGKPAPGMIEGCAQELGFTAGQVVMVGDTDRDTLAGQAAGCLQTVAVLNGSRLTPSIQSSASLVLPNTSDLLV